MTATLSLPVTCLCILSTSPWSGSIIRPISETRKLSLRRVRVPTKGHPANRCSGTLSHALSGTRPHARPPGGACERVAVGRLGRDAPVKCPQPGAGRTPEPARGRVRRVRGRPGTPFLLKGQGFKGPALTCRRGGRGAALRGGRLHGRARPRAHGGGSCGVLSPGTVQPLAPRPELRGARSAARAPALPVLLAWLRSRRVASCTVRTPALSPAAATLQPRRLIAAGGGGPGRGRRLCASQGAGDAPVPQAPPPPRARRGTAVTVSCRSPGYSPKYLLATSPARPDNPTP